MIDLSPMYGSSQKVIGYGLDKLKQPASLFSAEKVWISSGSRGPGQIEASRRYWGVPRFDLLQVHNLLSWEEHLKTLFAMKAAGQLRYVGITTSEGRRHRDIEQIMRTQPLDFVQVTYNILDREVEDRILPLARDRGIARHRQPAVPRGRADEKAATPSAARPGRRRSAARAGRRSSSNSSSRTRR